MHNTSTQQPVPTSTDTAQTPVPNPKTIAFIKQFARAYTYLPGIKPAFAGIIIN